MAPLPSLAYAFIVTAVQVDLGLSDAVSCPVTGCGTTPPAGTEWALGLPMGSVVSDGLGLFWRVGLGDVASCPLTGCIGGPTTIAGGVPPGLLFDVVPPLATDGTSIYFFDDTEDAVQMSPHGPRLLRCPVAGCPRDGAEILHVAPPVGHFVTADVAVDATTIYFTDYGMGGVLVRMPK
jgi:hypothetical protein